MRWTHYCWSGHAQLVGTRTYCWQNTKTILARFASRKRAAAAAYRKFIEDGWGMGRRADLTSGGLRHGANGWEALTEGNRHREYQRGDERILGEDAFVTLALQRMQEEINRKENLRRAGMTLDALAIKACDLMGIKPEDLKRKGRLNRVSSAKALIAYWGQKEMGFSGAEIARYLGMTRQGAHHVSKLGERVAREKHLNLTT